MHTLFLPEHLAAPYVEAIGRAEAALLNAQRSEDTQAIDAAKLQLKQRQREASHRAQAFMRDEYERISHQERQLHRHQSFLLTA